MSSNQSADCHAQSAHRERATDSQGLGSPRDIRHALIKADLVDCRVTRPGLLFYRTQIPACLWLSWENENAGKSRAVSELELALAA